MRPLASGDTKYWVKIPISDINIVKNLLTKISHSCGNFEDRYINEYFNHGLYVIIISPNDNKNKPVTTRDVMITLERHNPHHVTHRRHENSGRIDFYAALPNFIDARYYHYQQNMSIEGTPAMCRLAASSFLNNGCGLVWALGIPADTKSKTIKEALKLYLTQVKPHSPHPPALNTHIFHR